MPSETSKFWELDGEKGGARGVEVRRRPLRAGGPAVLVAPLARDALRDPARREAPVVPHHVRLRAGAPADEVWTPWGMW